MLKKQITFVDFDGVTRTEEFHFNLSKSEIIEAQSRGEQDIRDQIRAMVANKDMKSLMAAMKDLVGTTVGRREGNRFVKTDEIRVEFLESPAYDELIMEFFTVQGSAAAFIKAVVPADVSGKIDEAATMRSMGVEVADGELKLVDPVERAIMPRDISATSTGMGEIVSVTPVEQTGPLKGLNDYTREELLEMDDAEFRRVAGTDETKWSRDMLLIAFARRSAGHKH